MHKKVFVKKERKKRSIIYNIYLWIIYFLLVDKLISFVNFVLIKKKKMTICKLKNPLIFVEKTCSLYYKWCFKRESKKCEYRFLMLLISIWLHDRHMQSKRWNIIYRNTSLWHDKTSNICLCWWILKTK